MVHNFHRMVKYNIYTKFIYELNFDMYPSAGNNWYITPLHWFSTNQDTQYLDNMTDRKCEDSSRYRPVSFFWSLSTLAVGDKNFFVQQDMG